MPRPLVIDSLIELYIARSKAKAIRIRKIKEIGRRDRLSNTDLAALKTLLAVV